MANVSQLQPALTPQVQTSSSQAPEKDADFLALRLVNKRARLRLSPEPLDLASFPGKGNLFTSVNSKGWFAAVTRDASGASALISSPLQDLRSALAAASAEDEQLFKPQRRVPISGASPQILTFACNDSKLLLGLVDGSIHVYASDRLLSSGEGPVQPIHVFTSSSATLLSIQPNPGDIPELIAVLRDCTHSPGSLAVEFLDVQKLISSGGWMAGKSPSTTPTSISWSPKGKQLALGLQSGDIITFSPTATAIPKSSIPHPPTANTMSVISVHWLSTTSFHTIYAPPGQLTPDMEQIHFHVSLDSKNNSAQDIRFNNPYLPFPGLRPPGEFLVRLPDWNPSKVLLFIGDSTSSDIGLIGSMASDSGEIWHDLSLEETSTPSLPLDKDQNDTILLGMDVDLTSTESYHHSTSSGEALELSASPVMYVYASDGTILGWHVLNVTGVPYPGMVTTVDMSISAPDVPSSMLGELSLSLDMQTTPAISPATSATMETFATKPPSTVSGAQDSAPSSGSGPTTTPTTFGQSSASAFGSVVASGFGAFSSTGPAKFGQTTFGQPSPFGAQSSTPTFGSTTTPSTSGQTSASAFGSIISSGFGAFGSTGPAKFGQTTFGQPSPLGTHGSTPAFGSTTSPSVSGQSSTSPGSAASSGGFATFSSTGPAKFGQTTFGQPSLLGAQGATPTFGSTTTPSTTGQISTSASDPAASGGGFASFSSTGPAKFGQTTFGQPSLLGAQGTTPTFGPTITPSTSGQTSTSASDSAASSGGFTSFSSTGPAKFGQTTFSQPSPLGAQGSTPASGLTTTPSVFGQSSTSAFGSAPSSGLSAFSSTGPAKFGQATFGQPSAPGAQGTTPASESTTTPLKPSSTSNFGTTTSGSAFSAFTSAGPTKFGQPSPLGAQTTTTSESTVIPLKQSSISAFSAATSSGVFSAFNSVGPAKFGQPSPLGAQGTMAASELTTTPSKQSSTSAFSAATSSNAFSAFSSAGPAKFGQATFDQPSAPDTQGTTPASESTTTSLKQSTTSTFGTAASSGAFSAFGSTGPAKFGQTTFRQPSPIGTQGSTPASGSTTPSRESSASGFSSTAPSGAFSGFGSTGPAKTTFRQPSPIGAQGSTPVSGSTTTPSGNSSMSGFGSATPSGGFGAFVSVGPTKFGQAAFNFGGSAQTTTPTPPPSTSTRPSTFNLPQPTTLFGANAIQSKRESTARDASLATPSISPDVSEEEEEEEEEEEVASEAADEEGTEEASEVAEEEETATASKAADEEGTKERAAPPAPVPPPAPTPTPEQGMQAECSLLISTLNSELENFKQLAMGTSVKTAQHKKTSGVAHQKADLGDPRKWVFGDIEEYGRLLVEVPVDVKELKLERVSLRKATKELDSSMLKVNTRKEEIARFNKAKTDTEFAKMLKIRTLSPENSETQSQLRRSIRAIKDRVQKLEDHLRTSRKRINEVKTGRPSIRPPSLDTVNRTFRNIDIAIDQQKQEISQLRHRMAKLDVSGGAGTLDQLALSSSKRPVNVTPNVAITTAAALNAERSAQRLKKALLASRTQPLLNTTATASPLAPSFQTPQKGTTVKPEVKTPDVNPPKSEGVLTFPTTPMSFPPSLPAWTPPPPADFGRPGTCDNLPSRNRSGIKYHQKPIVLKKSASPASPTSQPSPFDWKPVEPIRPVSSLPFALRPAGSS